MKINGRHYNCSKLRIDKKKLSFFLFFWIIAFIILAFNIGNLIAYFTATVSAQNAFTIEAEYIVIFDANGGTGTMSNQSISYNVQTPLAANLYTRTDYIFYNWNTEADGSGTSYSNQEEVNNLVGANNQPVTLYAQWLLGNPVAEINGTFYSSLQDAVSDVPTDDTETTVKLLRDTTEAIHVNAHQNVVFDLQNYTISNDGSTRIIDNYGTIKISNGTLTTNAAQGAINNESGAKLVIDGGSIIATGSGSRQAIYNNGGIVEISGTAYLCSESNTRAAVQNQSKGTLNITGGTIVSTRYYGVQNAGKMTIGTEDGVSNKTTPVIQGFKHGIYSTANFSFFDGIAKGATSAISDVSKVANKETGYNITNSEETIDGKVYKTAYLSISNVVTFNPNGGTVSETSRAIENGNAIGNLPVPTRAGYNFLGWFTDPDVGTQITASTIVTQDITYYAHWQASATAEINGTTYNTLKAAINAVPANNTQTTIRLLRDASENVTVPANKNILFDIGNYTLSSATNNAVITNDGTITITNGNIYQTYGFAAINNNTTGKVIMTGGNITSTGTRAAIYTVGNGIVEISGDAYLSSNASGFTTLNQNTYERGTVQAVSATANTIITGGTIIATDGVGVSTCGPLTLGVKNDGVVSTTSPVIKAETSGIKCTNTLNFYDGIVKGKSGAIDGTISDCEPGYVKVDGTESINGATYYTAYLDGI